MGRFAFFAFGIGLGAGVSLLYAPKTGKDTRRWLNKTGYKARKSANTWIDRGKAGACHVRKALESVAA